MFVCALAFKSRLPWHQTNGGQTPRRSRTPLSVEMRSMADGLWSLISSHKRTMLPCLALPPRLRGSEAPDTCT
jgi:hypothetical protein